MMNTTTGRFLRTAAATVTKQGHLQRSCLAVGGIQGGCSCSGCRKFRGGSFFHSNAAAPRSFETTFDLPDPAIYPSDQKPLALTKIVATIGPTSEQAEALNKCVAAGFSSMRLNFSHATPEEVELRCTNLSAVAKALTPTGVSKVQNVVSILLDTKGPELRTGKLANDVSGHDTVDLHAGDVVMLHASPSSLPDQGGSTATDLLIDFPPLATVLQEGRQVLLDDGTIVLTVVSTDPAKGQIRARVFNTGSLRSRAGVNLPLADTAQHLPALSAKDKDDIAYGMRAADIDFVAASFVQTAAHVRDIRAHCAKVAAELGDAWKDKPLPLIISKIETASALQHFDEILDASDGIMVARGDLGVEIPLQQVTNAQKEMVAACNAVGKPVIVATQMLESMGKSPRPTRAEVSDVTNAVYDGADCVMLSGESAKGRYPDGSIKIMNEIIVSSERYALNGKALGRMVVHNFVDSPGTAISAMAKAAVSAANERDGCHSILVIMQPPGTVVQDGENPAPYTLPGLVSSFRPNVPIFTFTQSYKQARQLSLYRGVHPILVDASPNAEATALAEAKTMGYVSSGDETVVVLDHGDTASMKIVAVP